MKKVGDIMKELGFNGDSSDSVKEAFIRHLIKVSVGTDIPTRHSAKAESPKESKLSVEQMSFSFEDNELSKKAI